MSDTKSKLPDIFYNRMGELTLEMEKKGITMETIRNKKLLESYYDVIFDLGLMPEWSEYFSKHFKGDAKPVWRFYKSINCVIARFCPICIFNEICTERSK